MAQGKSSMNPKADLGPIVPGLSVGDVVIVKDNNILGVIDSINYAQGYMVDTNDGLYGPYHGRDLMKGPR